VLELIFVSLVWAFSFGLIKGQLSGLDPNFVAATRLAISLLVFLPFFRPRQLNKRLAARLMLTGAVQYGLMYAAYNASFAHLQAHQVALFTIFTPLYVTLIHDALQRRFTPPALAAALLAVAGTALVQGLALLEPGMLAGFALVQLSNLAFAFGQVDYRAVMSAHPRATDRGAFALLYLGGALAAGIPAVFTTPWAGLQLTAQQGLALLYLGAVASGACFFLWNKGARRVSAGALAVFNNAKIPLAVAVSLLVFGEQADLPRLLAGGAVLLAALLLNEWGERRRAAGAAAA